MTITNPLRFARRRLVVAAIAIAMPSTLALATTPAQASGSEVAGSSYLRAVADTHAAKIKEVCPAGNSGCLIATLKEQASIADKTAQTCDHNAVFARAYLRMTQLYGHTRAIRGYYRDVHYANRMDAVFGKYYTDAYHHWRSGERDSVPQAWLIAFDAAKEKRTNGAGDMLLGMNAHINRDLPYVMASIGLKTRRGVSGFHDYKVVENWLFEASRPLTAEFVQRFDPTMGPVPEPSRAPAPADWLVSTWRDNAWNNAQALVDADTPEERAAVEKKIEDFANFVAEGVLATESYTADASSTEERDDYCARHQGDQPPLEYAFGKADPYGWRF